MRTLVALISLWSFAGVLPAQIPDRPARADILFSAVELATDKVTIAKSLGPLFENLVVAYSLDRPFGGSLEYVRPGGRHLRATTSGDIHWVNDAGRQCASFTPGSAISTPLSALDLGKNYSLTIWMKLPGLGGNALIWEEGVGPLLSIKGADLILGSKGGSQTLATLKPTPSGWHHVALTCDGHQTSVYFDGALKGAAPVAEDCSVHSIGGSVSAHPGNSDRLDDMLVFDRALTPQEVVALGSFRLPMHPAVPGEVALVREAALTNAAVHDFRIVPPPPASPEVAAAAAKLAASYRRSLVFIATRDGLGSGFVASYANGTYLFTNGHIASRMQGGIFTNLDGEKVPSTKASIAVDHDTFLLQATFPDKPFEIMKAVDQEATIGDDVVVLDNLEGTGRVDTMIGKVVGIGPNLVEIDAPFVAGNSGSPIVHVKSGKVLGVTAYITVRKFDAATRQLLATPKIRRFGYRFDSVKSWQPVNWVTFSAQAQEMERIETLTADLIQLVKDLETNHHISPDLHTNPAIKSYLDTFATQTHGRVNERDVAGARSGLIANLKTACRLDVSTAQQHITYDYFRRQLANEQRDRVALADLLERDIQTIQTAAPP